MAVSGLDLSVAEDPSHHRQALGAHHHLGGKRVPEIVNPHVHEPGGLAYPPPSLLQVLEAGAFLGADDDIRVALDPRGVGQNLERRPVQWDRLGSGLGGRQVNSAAPDVLPLQGLDL